SRNPRAHESERGRHDGAGTVTIREDDHPGAACRPRTRTPRRGHRHVCRYRWQPERNRDHRGQLQPVDPAAGRFQSRRSDPEDLASHLLRHGTAVVFDLPKYGDGICLARMAGLLETLGVDRARLQRISVAVTGSNGKGSTAAMCAQTGRAYGLRTGLFTSPHLLRFNERVQIDGVEVGDDALLRLKLRIDAAIATVSKSMGEKFGAFE